MNENPEPDMNADPLLGTLADESLKVHCIACGEEEWILALDDPLDDIFIANYHCDICDKFMG